MQVVILIFLPNMRGYKSLNKMKGLNSLIVLQYLARLYPIYSFCMQLNKMKLGELSKPDDPTKTKTRIGKYVDKIKSIPGRVPKLWVPAVVNFIMYIIVSHVSFYLLLFNFIRLLQYNLINTYLLTTSRHLLFGLNMHLHVDETN